MTTNYIAKLFLTPLLSLCISSGMVGQVNLGSDKTARGGALLDFIENNDGSANKGLVLPRVALEGLNTLKPCSADEAGSTNAKKHIGLIVYNVTIGNGMCPGIYLWEESEWKRLQESCLPLIALNQTTKKVSLGRKFSLSAQAYSPQEEPVLVWSSDNPSIVSVDNTGLCEAKGVGTTEIVVTFGDGSLKAKCEVTVATSANSYKYRLMLTDKGPSEFTVNNPSEYLSQRAIDRRQRQNIKIDSRDLPISEKYIKAVENLGVVIVARSKWHNTISVHCYDEFMLEELMKLAFVKEAQIVWRGNTTTRSNETKTMEQFDYFKSLFESQTGETATRAYASDASYGHALGNIDIHKGQMLHEKGFKGQGIEIAVLDAGFNSINTLKASFNMNIKGTKSYIYKDESMTVPQYPYGQHGIWVLSTMAANKENTFVGTAPNAGYWLFRTEDPASNYPIQEDYWVTAVEYADSAGVDIVTASLGYKNYSIPTTSYTHTDTNGNSYISRGAYMATEKGMFIVCSSGNYNDAADRWVSPPADAHNVLTVGAVKPNKKIFPESGNSMTADNRMKPDVVSLGDPSKVVNIDGNANYGLSGTSFSAPIFSGLVACLWQAFPKLTNIELLEVIKKSSDRSTAPTLPYGNGIPDMEKAYLLAKGISDAKQ